MDKLLTPKEIASLLQLRYAKILELLKLGQLKAITGVPSEIDSTKIFGYPSYIDVRIVALA